jgi:hypothetical protein
MKKHKKNAGSFVIGLVAFAAAAVAQPGSVEFASGLPHTSLGGALIGPAEGRRLPVRNLGSSGEDGVEVQLHSLFGGGVAIDAGGLLATAGGEIKIKHKGWDGLIYGTHRCRSNGDGTGSDQFDFSALGVSSYQVTDYDASGRPISTTIYGGPIVDIGWVGQVIQCNPPSYWVTYGGWFMVNGKMHYTTWRRCVTLGTNPTGGGWYDYARVVTPIFDPGSEPFGLDSMEVSASNLSEFTVVASEIGTFGAASSGLGTAHVSEQCDASLPCGADERVLRVSNIGSSGQDGVQMTWPAASHLSYQCDWPVPQGGGSPAVMEMAALYVKPRYNVKQNIKCRIVSGGPSAFTTLSYDTADFNHAHIRVRTFVDGVPTGGGSGDPQGFVINLGALEYADHPRNLWNQIHLEHRMQNLRDPSGEPVTVFLLNNGVFTIQPADEISVEVLTSDTPDALAGLTVTASDTQGGRFSIRSLSTSPLTVTCTADVDDGSGTGSPDGGVTIDDLLYYLAIFEAGELAADVDDGSGTGALDGGVTIDDLLYYLLRFESGC